jgi:hypothetical protein
MNPIVSAALLLFGLALSIPARGESLKVNPDNGNNTFSAVFDAPLGERITAVSWDIAYDEAAGTASGRCSVPLITLMVDNEKTKTEHFRDWVTN